ncbi:helix-turn-helix transcriptional regulator [Georgenia yuyongxinii]|uniref:Helix-turn-helix transcriptional regulator n=1 Tax=Georgenia yuyongxinii TaxID=2589797 RepID=A0A552WLA4_9MICO|nr:helix-turn-helix transcriptional regulator [Georgenia yuyongxinii]TRW43429.1 helix-turn-helix transcriptional regulator [Georgenia yuyongxinii]
MVPQRESTRPVAPVRARRKELGLTQAELAAAVHISRQTVISIESGGYAPSVYLALRIARALGAPVEDLFIEADDDSEKEARQ